jgi:predicted metalloprotease with PDZ domain
VKNNSYINLRRFLWASHEEVKKAELGVRYEIVYNYGGEVRTLYTNSHRNVNGFTVFVDKDSGYETRIPINNVITITEINDTEENENELD